MATWYSIILPCTTLYFLFTVSSCLNFVWGEAPETSVKMTRFCKFVQHIINLFRQPDNWQAFLPLLGFAELPLSKPRPHIVNNCCSQCDQDWNYHSTEPRNRQHKDNWIQTAACQILICLLVVVQAADNIDTLCDFSGNNMTRRMGWSMMVYAYKITRNGLSFRTLQSPLSWQHVHKRLMFLSLFICICF